MLCPNDYDILYNTGTYNPDSIMIDSCVDSPTYLHKYTKKYYFLNFKEGQFPFNNQLYPDSITTLNEIPPNKIDIYYFFKELENKFGKFYFIGRPDTDDVNTFQKNPGCRIFFEKIQNVSDICEFLNLNISIIRIAIYGDRHIIPTDGIYNMKSSIIIKPNPVYDYLEISLDEESIEENNIEIMTISGIVIMKIPFNNKVNISSLNSGIYFIKIGNKIQKFLKL